MRGAQTLFLQLLEDDETVATTVSRNSGRDKALLQKRDVKLVHRHYYYLKIQKLQYQDILDNLSSEFDLAVYTIIERLQLQENHSLLRRLIKEDKKLPELRKEYPYLNWNTAA